MQVRRRVVIVLWVVYGAKQARDPLVVMYHLCHSASVGWSRLVTFDSLILQTSFGTETSQSAYRIN